MNEATKEKFRNILEKRGAANLMLHAVEEMTELQKEILKNVNRKKDNVNEIFEELADTVVMIEYIKMVYDISDEKLFDYINNKTAAMQV